MTKIKIAVHFFHPKFAFFIVVENHSILHYVTAIATHQGIKARSYLLKGAVETPARNHGITRHYEKAGGKGAMINDFYRVVKRSQVSDAVVSILSVFLFSSHYENTPM